MKYFVMSMPEPSRKSLERRVVERVYTVREEAKKQGATDDQAATMALLNYTKIMHEEIEDDSPHSYYGGSARRRIVMLERRRKKEWSRGRRYASWFLIPPIALSLVKHQAWRGVSSGYQILLSRRFLGC